MKAESININWDYLNPAWIFGPILDKELRVSSRRKRNYFLRSVYIVLLGLIILFMWLTAITISNASSSTFQISRSALIGTQVTIAIIWFQFIVSQLLAIVMLSSSISDEIRSGTLNVLMTTPVNSFQIVTGKLFSKLLQILLLLAISFPLLSIIRVFGGIPWSYVVFSLCITVTSVILAGSLSLFLSVFIRQAYHVIVIEIIGYILFFTLTAVLLFILEHMGLLSTLTSRTILAFTNPLFALYLATFRMSPGSMLGYSWIIQYFFILGISGVFIVFSIWKTRSAPFRNISSRQKNNESNILIKDEIDSDIKHYYIYSDHIKRVYGIPIIWKERYSGNEYSERIKRVIGNPIIWKENYGNFFGKGIIDKIATITIYLLCIFGILSLLVSRGLSMVLVSLLMSGIYLMLLFRLAISTAGSISKEKEARTLPILLVTPLEDKDIILSKVKAALKKNISIIILYNLLYLTLVLSGLIGVVGYSRLIYQIPISVISIASSILFVVGCGSYFGVCLKNSTTAIAATIGTYFVTHPLIGILNPIIMFFLARMASPRTLSLVLGFTSSFFTIIIFGAIGLYLLKKSIRNLRSNIF